MVLLVLHEEIGELGLETNCLTGRRCNWTDNIILSLSLVVLKHYDRGTQLRVLNNFLTSSDQTRGSRAHLTQLVGRQ